jgi:hypothetical protein
MGNFPTDEPIAYISPTEIGKFLEEAVDQALLEDNNTLERNRGRGADFEPTKSSRLVIAVNNWYLGCWMTPKECKDRVIKQLHTSDPQHHGVWVHIITRLTGRSRNLRHLLKSCNIHLIEVGEQLLADAQHDLTTFTRVVETIRSKLHNLYSRARFPSPVLDSELPNEYAEVELPYFDIVLYCSPEFYNELYPLVS